MHAGLEAGTVPFQASAGPRSYRQLDEEAAAGAESHRVRTGLAGSEYMPGPNDSFVPKAFVPETFMPSPSRVHPGQSLQSPGRSGSRATDYLPNSGGPRASDFLPGRVPIPAATYPPAAGGYAAGAGYVRGYDGFDAEWHLPAQPSKGDAPLDTEFTLLSREHPSTASRVERLPLTHGERDMVSYALRRVQDALRRADEFATTAREWSSLGNRLYTAQIVAAASVPVLIGLLGSFEDGFNLFLRILAIFLSIVGSLCSAVESVYQFRARGQVRYGYAERMHNLFNAFSTLSGTLFDPNCSDPSDSSTEVFIPDISAIPRNMLRAHLLHLDELDARQEGQAIVRAGRHSGQNFKVFCAAFNRLQDQCRVSAFVDTVGKAQAAFDTAATPAGSGGQHGRSRMATPLSGAGMRWDRRGGLRSFAG